MSAKRKVEDDFDLTGTDTPEGDAPEPEPTPEPTPEPEPEPAPEPAPEGEPELPEPPDPNASFEVQQTKLTVRIVQAIKAARDLIAAAGPGRSAELALTKLDEAEQWARDATKP